MPLYHDIVGYDIASSTTTGIRILNYDGVDKIAPVTSGVLAFAAGVGVTLTPDDYTGELVLAMDISAGANDPYYQEKFNKLVNGGRYPATPPYDYEFGNMGLASSSSGDLTRVNGLYIATISQHPPYNSETERNFMLLGSACMQVGLCDYTVCTVPDVPSEVWAEAAPYILTIFNMCTYDVDCEDYRRMFVYLEEIRSALDCNKNKNLEYEEGSSSSSGETCIDKIGLLMQYEAMVHYWNFAALLSGFTFDLAAGDSSLIITTGYEAPVCGTYPAVAWSITIAQTAGDVITLDHRPTSCKVSRVVLRPALPGGNPIYINVPAPMKQRDYVLVSSFAKAPAGSSQSSTSEGLKEFRVTVEWTGTNVGTVSMYKDIEVAM